MPLYVTAQYRVKPQAVAKVKQAIEEFVRTIKANEPGTHLHLAWRQKDDRPASCTSSSSRMSGAGPPQRVGGRQALRGRLPA